MCCVLTLCNIHVLRPLIMSDRPCRGLVWAFLNRLWCLMHVPVWQSGPLGLAADLTSFWRQRVPTCSSALQTDTRAAGFDKCGLGKFWGVFLFFLHVLSWEFFFVFQKIRRTQIAVFSHGKSDKISSGSAPCQCVKRQDSSFLGKKCRMEVLVKSTDFLGGEKKERSYFLVLVFFQYVVFQTCSWDIVFFHPPELL